jgi:hypothetical protein
VTIYGHAGMLLGTPGFASIYGGAGLVIGSTFPSMLGYDVNVLAAHDLALTALVGEANLSGKKAVVMGRDEAKVESPRLITLESKTTAGGAEMTLWPTGATLKVAGPAQSVQLEMSSSGDLSIIAGTAKVTILASGAVQIQATNVEISGNLKVTGDLHVDGAVVAKKDIATDESVSAGKNVVATGDMKAQNWASNVVPPVPKRFNLFVFPKPLPPPPPPPPEELVIPTVS